MRDALSLLTATSLLDIVELRAASDAHGVAFRFLPDGERESESLTFGQVSERARRLAALLQDRARPGDPVLLAFPAGLDFIVAFVACIYARMVAIPVEVPARRGRAQRLDAIARAADAKVGLSVSQCADILPDAGLAWSFIDTIELPEPEQAVLERPSLGDEAYVQFTSGSTGAPRGAVITHAALLDQLEYYRQRAGEDWAKLVYVTWLPHTHDFGLVGFFLASLYQGLTLVFMPPSAFLQRPMRWLEVMSRHGGGYSGGPSFGYELCLRDADRNGVAAGLDLTSWKIASLGGDYVQPDLLDRFEARFGKAGFSRGSWLASYGLSEAVLCVTSRLGPRVTGFDRQALSRGHAQCIDDGPGDRLDMLSAGRPLDGQKVVIVDPEARKPLPEGCCGEIWVAGLSLASRYWGMPPQTEASLEAYLAGAETGERHLRTGDLGFIHEGELYVTGRVKDMLVIRGANHAPDDVEATLQASHDAFNRGGGALFQTDLADGAALVLVQEVRRTEATDIAELMALAARVVAEHHGLRLDEIRLIRAGSLPRSASGKVARSGCRTAFLAGELAQVGAWTRSDMSADESEAVSPTEAHLKAQLTQLLPDQPLTRRTNLFEAGMDSLAAQTLIARVKADFGVDIPSQHVFEGPDIASLAEHIDRAAKPLETGTQLAEAELVSQLRHLSGLVAEQNRLLAQLLQSGRVLPGELPGELPRPALNRADPATPRPQRFATLPLTEMQLEILHFCELYGQSAAAFNQVMVLEGPAPLTRDKAAGAIHALWCQHESLRAAQDGETLRVAGLEDGCPCEPEMLEAADEEAVASLVRSIRNRKIDPRARPLWQLSVITCEARCYLVFSGHHLILDGASMPVIAHTLAAHLGTGSPDRIDRFDPAPGLDAYGKMRAQRRAQRNRQHDLAYWRNTLGRTLPDWLPPGHSQRIAKPSYDVERYHFDIEASLVERLRVRAKRLGVSLPQLVLTSYATLLQRLSGQKRILVGLNANDRTDPQLQQLVGCCNAFLPVVADFEDGPDLASIARRIAAAALDASVRRDVTLADWAQAENIRPDPDRWFKISASFNWQSFPEAAGDFLPRFDLEMASLTHAPTGLALDIREQADGLWCEFVANPAFVERALCARLPDYMTALLSACGDLAVDDLFDVDLLTADDRARLETLAVSPTPAPAYRPVLDIIGEQAWQRAEAWACRDGDRSVTYAELWARARAQAGHLSALDLPAGSHIGLFAERSLEAVIAQLSVWMAGHVYVPLDVRAPHDRLMDQIARADLRLLLCDETHADQAHALGQDAGFEAQPVQASAPCSDVEFTPVEAKADDAAYVFFTSGSTGQPKAARVAHHGMMNHVCAKIGDLQMGCADRTAFTAPLTFDISIWQVLAPLMSGGCIEIYRDTITHDPVALFSRVQEDAVSILQLVPTAVRGALESLLSSGGRQALPALRWLILTGEALPPDICRKWISLFPDIAILNAYGPTECSDDVTHDVIDWPPDEGQARMSIGRPLPGVRVHVVDPRGQDVPPGVAGELQVSGLCVGLGYYKDEARTEMAFPRDRDAYRGRRYATGDLARFTPDGKLDFLGRLDHQIKLNGIRIEPGEIEAALNASPAVLTSLVVVDEAGKSARLVAYIVARDGMKITPSELKARCRLSLPQALIPSAFVCLDELPLNTNGKIDRAALPAPEHGAAPADRTSPSSPTQFEIKEIWAAVLGSEEIGIHEDFFDRGGRSLEAARISRQISEAFIVDLQLAHFYRNPTIFGLAKTVDELARQR